MYIVQVVLPGVSRDVFLALREYLYTGDCPAGATLNCLGTDSHSGSCHFESIEINCIIMLK